MLSVCAAVALPTPHLPCVSSIHASHVGRCHCDCVLVDVGLNNGDSLLSWPKAALASAQDHGEADAPVWRRLHSCMASSAACYYGFEANPDFSGRLEALEAQLREDGRPVRLFTETAFSTSSEGADVFVEPAKFGTGQQVSTLDPHVNLVTRQKGVNCSSGADSTPGVHGRLHCGKWMVNKSTTAESHYVKTRVASIDGGEFLAELVRASGFVALKVGVESVK